jgi:hypothetical protein
MFLPIVALLTVTLQPAAPTVGDPITVTFDAPVVLDRSESYEVVGQQGARVVVRTFEPKPFAMSGTMSGTGGKVRFRNLIVPVKSVLEPKDQLKPAPLVPPRPVPYPRAPFVAIAIAAAAALLAWVAAWRASRRAVVREEPALPADVRFRRAVEAARGKPARWAALADATRMYLAATRSGLGTELTTTELLRRLEGAVPRGSSGSSEFLGGRNGHLPRNSEEPEEPIPTILRQGDLEKFSTSGPAALDFDRLAVQALELIPPAVPEPAREVAA